MTPEGKVKAKVKELLKKYGVYYFMPVPYGKTGIPDFVCCVRGRFVGIETKAGKNKCTKLQELEHQRIIESGGMVFVHNEVSLDNLENWLKLQVE